MNAASYGSMGIQVTSSFKSSGRSKQLLSDGQRFQTIRNEGSNVGPGSYDAGSSYIGRISTSPTANDRNFRANRAKDKNEANFRETLRMLSVSHIHPLDRASPVGTGISDSTKTQTLDDSLPMTPTVSPSVGRKKTSPGESQSQSKAKSNSNLTGSSRTHQLHLLNCRKTEILEVQRLPSYE